MTIGRKPVRVRRKRLASKAPSCGSVKRSPGVSSSSCSGAVLAAAGGSDCGGATKIIRSLPPVPWIRARAGG
jgi:hypothetical protein